MKSIPLNDLIGRIHPNRKIGDMPVDAQYEAKTDTAAPLREAMPTVFHVIQTASLKDIKYWPDRDVITIEQDVLAYSHDDAIRQLGIQAHPK